MITRQLARRLSRAQQKVVDNDDIGWVGWDCEGRPVVFIWVKYAKNPNIRKPLQRAISVDGRLVEPIGPVADDD